MSPRNAGTVSTELSKRPCPRAMTTPSPPSCDDLLALAAKGWRVFPCRPRAKEPLIPEWQHKATMDSRQICAWYAEHPGCNWGIACGAGSGVWVLDVDGDKGKESLKRLLAQRGCLPDGFAVRTAKGGGHLYFAYPPGLNIRNSAGKIGEGLDVRGRSEERR